jgi:hypothetical protein
VAVLVLFVYCYTVARFCADFVWSYHIATPVHRKVTNKLACEFCEKVKEACSLKPRTVGRDPERDVWVICMVCACMSVCVCVKDFEPI